MRLHVMNPRRRRRKTAKKKATTKRRATPRRRRRKNTAMAAESNPRKRRRKTTRRRRRSSNPTSNPRKRRRSRRRNPSSAGGGLVASVKREVRSFIPSLAGKLWVAFWVRRMGAAGGLFDATVRQSPTMGGSWGWQQYMVGVIALYIGKNILGKWVNGSEFFRGGMDLMLTKAVWTEGIARMPTAQQWFGQAEGDITRTPDGQSWLMQGGQWVAMQGLVEADALDGLVEADALDGTGYGQLLPENVSNRFSTRAAYADMGSKNPYYANYM